jgi:hypothetical protein
VESVGHSAPAPGAGLLMRWRFGGWARLRGQCGRPQSAGFRSKMVAGADVLGTIGP